MVQVGTEGILSSGRSKLKPEDLKMSRESKTRDYFAEMYVAGMLADQGWNIYFPRRDKGFDFIITKSVGGASIVRPVQVKGKYPQGNKTDKAVYGYVGRLTQLHDDMVLVIAFFSSNASAESPDFIAFVPRARISAQVGKGYQCQPAKFSGGKAVPRKSFEKYFGIDGIRLMERLEWE